MKVEHITMGGTSVIKNATNLPRKSEEIFKPFEIKLCEAMVIQLPLYGFSSLLTSKKEGAIFTFFNGEFGTKSFRPFLNNVCCFDSAGRNVMMQHVVKDYILAIQLSSNSEEKIVLPNPTIEKWICSTVLPGGNFLDYITAGEIELYIFYALLQARIKPEHLFDATSGSGSLF